jgi:hypothetical protein
MKRHLVYCLLSLGICMAAEAMPTPAERRIDSFTVTPAAASRIESIDSRELMDDARFVATLRRILEDPELLPIDQADAFYLMLRKIGWEFTGTVRVPPNRTYLETFDSMAVTYLGYQGQLGDLRIDPTALLSAPAFDCASNVVRCSNALVLSVLLDRKKSASTVRTLIDRDAIQNAEVPGILIHNLALAVVLSRDVELARSLAKLLPHVTVKESQEDILCAISYFQSPEIAATIKSFLLETLKTKFNSAVDTGILALKKRLTDAQFGAAYAELIEAAAKPEWKERLVNARKTNFTSFRSRTIPGGMMKVWADFDVTMYDDGMVFTHGKRFRAFLSK